MVKNVPPEKTFTEEFYQTFRGSSYTNYSTGQKQELTLFLVKTYAIVTSKLGTNKTRKESEELKPGINIDAKSLNGVLTKPNSRV